jgi:hypothetical protein
LCRQKGEIWQEENLAKVLFATTKMDGGNVLSWMDFIPTVGVGKKASLEILKKK